jgi:act minimal PKS acyl carrier protein
MTDVSTDQPEEIGMSEFTIEDLKRIMRESAGEDESPTVDGDVLDVTFQDLGYDSLALMETTSRVERALAVKLPEDEWQAAVLVESSTPRDFLRFVNSRLAGRV